MPVVKRGGARNPVEIRDGRATVTGEQLPRSHGGQLLEGGRSGDPEVRTLVRRGHF
jgi:hypothetical protein